VLLLRLGFADAAENRSCDDRGMGTRKVPDSFLRIRRRAASARYSRRGRAIADGRAGQGLPSGRTIPALASGLKTRIRHPIGG
jgi:hypothetical protein